MLVVPAILTSDIDSFWNQIERLLPFYNYFQVDIMDGTYGENKTISLKNILETVESKKNICEKIKVDFQLIIKDPEVYYDEINKLKTKLNIKFIIFHYKTKLKIDLLYDKLGLNIGIAIDPDDSIEQFQSEYDINRVKNIVIMTVYPKAQGQELLEYPLDKIEQLRNAGYRYYISVDGGVNENTIPLITSKKFQPDYLNIGSYFSKAENLEERINKVKVLIKSP